MEISYFVYADYSRSDKKILAYYVFSVSDLSDVGTLIQYVGLSYFVGQYSYSQLVSFFSKSYCDVPTKFFFIQDKNVFVVCDGNPLEEPFSNSREADYFFNESFSILDSCEESKRKDFVFF